MVDWSFIQEKKWQDLMNCLMELHHENKLIGIISHVSDLKDRIERQLVVERKQKQSVIQMI